MEMTSANPLATIFSACQGPYPNYSSGLTDVGMQNPRILCGPLLRRTPIEAVDEDRLTEPYVRASISTARFATASTRAAP